MAKSKKSGQRRQSGHTKAFRRVRAIIALLVLLAMMVMIVIPARAEEITLGTIRAVLTLPEGWSQAESADGELLAADNAEGVRLRLVSVTGETSEDQWNYGDYGDAVCNNLGNGLADRLKKAGYQNVEYVLVKADPVKWLRLSWEKAREEGTLYGIQYYTVVNGQGIELTFTAEAPISEGTAAQTETIAQSISFAEIRERPKTTDSTMKTSLIWIAGLAVAAGFTYFLTTRSKKK